MNTGIIIYLQMIKGLHSEKTTLPLEYLRIQNISEMCHHYQLMADLLFFMCSEIIRLEFRKPSAQVKAH